jgi:hypothetical protein
MTGPIDPAAIRPGDDVTLKRMRVREVHGEYIKVFPSPNFMGIPVEDIAEHHPRGIEVGAMVKWGQQKWGEEKATIIGICGTAVWLRSESGEYNTANIGILVLAP